DRAATIQTLRYLPCSICVGRRQFVGGGDLRVSAALRGASRSHRALTGNAVAWAGVRYLGGRRAVAAGREAGSGIITRPAASLDVTHRRRPRRRQRRPPTSPVLKWQPHERCCASARASSRTSSSCGSGSENENVLPRPSGLGRTRNAPPWAS